MALTAGIFPLFQWKEFTVVDRWGLKKTVNNLLVGHRQSAAAALRVCSGDSTKLGKRKSVYQAIAESKE